jgi:hypothetical protein
VPEVGGQGATEVTNLDTVKGGSIEVLRRRVIAVESIGEGKGLGTDAQNGTHLLKKAEL